MFAESMDTSNVEQIQEFMEESIKGQWKELLIVVS